MEKLNQVSRVLEARKVCIKKNNTEWIEKHEATIKEWIDTLPHGSGINFDYWIDMDNSGDNQIVFGNSWDYMNDNGYYDGVIDFKVKVTPSLSFGFNLLITGNFGKHQDIKEYLYDTYNEALKD